MTQVGESVAVTQISDPAKDHWAQIEYTYADGTPVQGLFTAVDGDGLTWTGYLNDEGQACMSGLPPGAVEFQLLPSESLQDELADLRTQIQTVLSGILEEQRAEAKVHEEALAQQSALGRGYSHYSAVRRGFWNGALGLLTFVKDVAVKVGETAIYLSPVTRLNNLLQASYTSYTNGELTGEQWRQSLNNNYQDEEFKDLAELLGFDMRKLSKDQVLSLMTEAYEIVAYIADDAEFREVFLQFGKDYAGAQSSVEWAEFIGGGLFEIVLTALLLVFTGGLGNAAQAASKVRHASRLRSLGGMLRKLGKLLQRKKLNKRTKGGVDSKHKVEVEKPEGQKLSSGEQPATQTAKAPSDYGVAFFGDDNVAYYTPANATIGRKGKSFFFMPIEDSGVVKNSADAARYTGRAPSAERAYLGDKDVYGLSFPTDGMSVAQPTAADAGGWPHFLEGGHTAIKTGDGPTAGYLVNPTREFVTPGGNAVPPGSVLFKLGPNGEWIPVRKY
jgi:hypothetical protein